jgi:beta-galactosidase
MARALSPAIAHGINSEAADRTQLLLAAGWEFFRGSLAGPWEVWNLSDADWHRVTVPHCFNDYDACDPDQPAYRGQGWYRARLQPANPWRLGRTLLHFGGAGQHTTLYVGEQLIGKNIGGYNEFVFDITDAARDADGQMRIAVLCDNSGDSETIPSDLSDFNLYGGLYRHVRLIYVPAVSVEMLHIVPEVAPGRPAQCGVQARLYNPAGLTGPVEIILAVTGPAGASVFADRLHLAPWQDIRELAHFTIDEPQLWSPTTPSLYQCQATLRSELGEQVCAERFGVRSFEFVEHGPFRLNGEKLFLRGTQRHEDHAGYAAAVPDDITRQEFAMIRAMGANFIRLAHYPQAELVLDLCDELGLIVWEELPWCRSGAGDAAMRDNACHLLRTMIEQHFNHPCIVFWSLGNEEDWPHMAPGDGKETVPSFLLQLQQIAHDADPSRLTAFRRCAPGKEIPDVYSPSIWSGWYSGRYQDYERTLEQNRPQVRHMLHMEWGADSHAGRHVEEPYGENCAPFVPDSLTPCASVELPMVKHADWSETYACDLFDWYLKTQETLPWFAGSAQWIFKDFSTPDRPENPIPRVNQKGLVERDLTKKEGYFVFQSYWSEQPMVHIYGHSWPMRWGRADQPRLVRVYSNGEQVELFLNGTSLGFKRRNSQDFPCAGLRWSPTFRPGGNTLRAIARRGAATIEDEVQFTYQTEAWGAPALLTIGRQSTSAASIMIEARLLDSRGNVCLDARNRVRFGIAGGGRFNDNRGTAAGSRVIELYNGRVAIEVLPGAQPSVISIQCEGVADAFLRLG